MLLMLMQSTSSIGSASLEVAIILLGAFILGYILSYEINKNKFSLRSRAEGPRNKIVEPGINLHNSMHSNFAGTSSRVSAVEKQGFEERTQQIFDETILQDADITVASSKTIDTANNNTSNGSDTVPETNTSDSKVLTDEHFLDDIKRNISDIKEDIQAQDNNPGAITLDNLSLTKPTEREEKASNIVDDLTVIHGITEDIENQLNSKGIQNFEQLGFSNIYELKNILQESSMTPHYLESWPQQAKLALDKEWKQLKDYQHELVINQHNHH